MLLLILFLHFFFFKQKTAYEMRISDWSSDVCSSDLLTKPVRQFVDTPGARERQHQRAGDEMIAPENIFLGRVGQRLFQYLDQAKHAGVEIFVHELRALGAVRRLRAERAIILPTFADLDIEVEERGRETCWERGGG